MKSSAIKSWKLWAVIFVAGCTAPTYSMPPGLPDAPQVATSSEGVVVAAQPLAAEAGARMLRAGGNAADAAVAAAFAVSVVEPSMNSIGGRTQVLIRFPDGSLHGIDATTQAPATYDPDTAPQASYGYATVGVPGAVAGLVRLLEEHGTMPLAQVMQPAIDLATDGFYILPGEAARHRAGADQLAEFEGSAAHFLTIQGGPRSGGSLFTQPDLARTLRTIAEGGADAFYRGPIAEQIVADMEANGGAVTAESLANYEALDAKIVRGSYRGYELVGTDVPAAGAVTIAILHVLENFDLSTLDGDSWAALVGTAVAEVFAHRGVPGDLVALTDKEWAAEVAAAIQIEGATLRVADREQEGLYQLAVLDELAPSPNSAEAGDWASWRAGRASVLSEVTPSVPNSAAVPDFAATDWTGSTWGPASSHTTHLSVADGAGMYVSLTQTIGPNLGSKVTTPGLGFLYAATLGGYLGRMDPGERARSSISPLMVLQDGEPVLVLGAAGGARIISAVVQAVVRVVDDGMSLADALAAARVHPIEDGIAMEMEASPGMGWTREQVREIESWGFQVDAVERVGAFGRIHGIWVDPTTGEVTGVADPDWEGAAVVPRDGEVGEVGAESDDPEA